MLDLTKAFDWFWVDVKETLWGFVIAWILKKPYEVLWFLIVNFDPYGFTEY